MSTIPCTKIDSVRASSIPAQPRRDDKRGPRRIPASLRLATALFLAAAVANGAAADEPAKKEKPAEQQQGMGNQPGGNAQPALFSLVRSTVTLPPGKEDGDGMLLISLKKPSAAAPVATIVFSSGAMITTGTPVSLNGATSGDWGIPITVKGLGRKAEEHFLRVTHGGASETRPFNVTNVPAEAFSWSVMTFGASARWSDDAPLTTTVVVGPVAATNLAAHAILVDAKTQQRFAGGNLKICLTEKADCVPVTTLEADKPHKLFLHPASSSASVPAGTYAGTIELISSQQKAPAAQTTLYVTTGWHKFFGILAIILGVLGSLLFALLVRNRLTRLQLLVPAAAIRRSLQGIADRLFRVTNATGLPVTKTAESVQNWQDRLSEQELVVQGDIPPWYSWATPSPTASTPYQTVLDRAGGWAIALDRLVQTGFSTVADTWRRLDPGDPQAARDAVIAAAGKVDDLSRPEAPEVRPLPAAPELAALDPQIAAIIAEMESALAKALNLQSDASDFSPGPREQERLQAQMRSLSLFGWGLAALLTIAVGSYVMVFENLGFGRPTDFLLCLLWGFGLPAVGSQTMMTSGQVGAAIGVSLPKGGA